MIQKYTASLLAVVIVMVGALAQITGGVTWTDAIQLALLFVGAIGIYIVKLLPGQWAAGFKVGIAVVTAILTALAPLVVGNHVFNGQEIAMVILAGLQALGAQVGVDLRQDATKLRAADRA